MIVVKLKTGGFSKEFLKETDAQNFINVLKRNKALKKYEFVSEKYKLDTNGIISGRRATKKDKRTD